MTGHTAEAPGVRANRRQLRCDIRPGVLDARMLEWFRRFPAATESREDDYLISPDLDGLSVKIRGGRALEVKMYRGGRGVSTVPASPRVPRGLAAMVISGLCWAGTLMSRRPGGRCARSDVSPSSLRARHDCRRASRQRGGTSALRSSSPR